jgi:hypothetical protein
MNGKQQKWKNDKNGRSGGGGGGGDGVDHVGIAVGEEGSQSLLSGSAGSAGGRTAGSLLVVLVLLAILFFAVFGLAIGISIWNIVKNDQCGSNGGEFACYDTNQRFVFQWWVPPQLLFNNLTAIDEINAQFPDNLHPVPEDETVGMATAVVYDVNYGTTGRAVGTGLWLVTSSFVVYHYIAIDPALQGCFNGLNVRGGVMLMVGSFDVAFPVQIEQYNVTPPFELTTFDGIYTNYTGVLISQCFVPADTTNDFIRFQNAVSKENIVCSFGADVPFAYPAPGTFIAKDTIFTVRG